MKGYKAFSKGLICRGKQYAENNVFEENTEICSKGMHFCKDPLDVFQHYPLVDKEGNATEFAEVEALDSAETHDGEAFCTKKLKIGPKLSLSQFIEASFDFASQAEALDSETLIGGNNAKLVGGIRAKLVGGTGATVVGMYCAKLVGGDCAKLVGGKVATVVGGNGATLIGGNAATLIGGINTKLVGGDNAILVSGDDAILTGNNNTKLVGGAYATLIGGCNATVVGDCGSTLVGGNNAKLVGDYATTLAGGNNAIIVGDHGSTAKGKKGSIIVLVERDGDLNIVNFKAVQVDGEKIKEDVLYKLEDGKLIQV